MRRELPAASGPPSNPLRIVTLVALVLVLLLAALRGSRPLVHDDLFWHLATGRQVAEQHQVPTTDIFSFTRAGERWVSHEWGFGLIAFALWSIGDYPALVALQAALAVAILLLLLRVMLQTAASRLDRLDGLAVPLLAVALWAVDAQLILRASLLSAVLMLALLLLLHRFDRRGRRGAIVAIALVFLVWGNLHGEVVFGLFVLGLATVESLLGRWPRAAKRLPRGLLRASPARPYLPVLLGCVALTLVNPNGVDVLLYPFVLARFLFAGRVPLEMGHFTAATPALMPGFYLLLAILLWSLLPLQSRNLPSLTEALAIAAFLLLALQSHRFIVYFTLLALPVIARLQDRASARRTRRRSPRWLPAAVLGLTLLIVGAGSAAAWRSHPRRAISRHFPAGAVRFLRQEAITGRMFNHQNYGGYLHWSLGAPVFWDGRNLLFAPLMREISQLPLSRVAERWQIDYLVVTEFEHRRLRDQIAGGGWGLAYWDDFAAVYLAREPRFDEILERQELRWVPPFGGVEGLEAVARDATAAAAWRRELDQVLGLEPDCQRAMYFQGLISFYQGDDARAEAELRAALRPQPNGYVFKALARVLERQGRSDEARRARIRAIELGAE